MDDIDLPGQVCQRQALLDGRITTSDNGHVEISEEHTVTDSAEGHAHSYQTVLAGDTHLHRVRTGGNDYPCRFEDLGPGSHVEPAVPEGYLVDSRKFNDRESEVLRLVRHPPHQLFARNPFRKTGVVFNKIILHRRTAGNHLLHEDRIDSSPFEIDPPGQSCGTGADDESFMIFCHVCLRES